MKKILTSLITLILMVCMAFAFGCGDSGYTKPTLTNPGNVLSQGGFVCETENYLYFINGEQDSTMPNAFGQPVKGALLAVEKSSLNTDNIKPQVIVPKLFTASDIKSGLFFNGDYVYYGSPCVDKNSSGYVANDQMTFFRTKLDGTSTQAFFTVDSLAVEYRFAEKDGVVYIIYYDTTDFMLVSYNTSDGTRTVIAKNSEKDGFYSLSDAKFLDVNSSVSVVYSTTIYSEEYHEEKFEIAGATRATESYNAVFSYSAGDALVEGTNVYGKKILDGKDTNSTYSLTYATCGHLFFSEKVSYETDSSNKAINLADNTIIDVINSDQLKDSTLIVSINEAYYYDEENDKIVRFAFTGSAFDKVYVADTDAVTTLFAKINNEILFINNDNYIAKISLDSNTEQNVIKVSTETVDATWYKPQVLSFGGTSYVFYIDNSMGGSEYVYFADVNGTVKSEETDDKTTYYLDNAKLLGIMIEEDLANPIISAIDNMETVLEYTENGDGTISFDAPKYQKALQLYEDLVASNKKVADTIPAEQTVKLSHIKQAMELGKLYYKLKDFTKAEKDNFATDYQNAKAMRTTLLLDSVDTIQKVVNLLPTTLKYYYQQAELVFDPAVNE